MFSCDNRPLDRLIRGNQLISGMKEMFVETRKKHGLKQVELQILSYLYMAGETENTSSDICKNLRMNKAMVSKTLDALNKREIVTFKTDENDRRYVHYFLSDGAKPIADDILKAWEYMQVTLFEGLSEQEVSEFMRMSKVIYSNMNKMRDSDNQVKEETEEC